MSVTPPQLIQRFAAQWKRLTEAPAAISDPLERWHINNVLTTLLVGALMGVALLILSISLGGFINLGTFVAVSANTLVLVLAYLVARRGFYLLAARLMLLTVFVVLVAVLYYTRASEVDNVPYFYIIPTYVASRLLRWQEALITVLLMLGLTLLTPFIRPDLQERLLSTFIFNLLGGTLILFATYFSRNTQQRLIAREKQLGDLLHSANLIAQASRESEQRYRALMQGTSDGVFIIGIDGQAIEANPQGLAILGVSLDEWRAQSARAYVAEGEQKDSQSVTQRLIAGETVQPYYRTMRRADGSSTITEVMATLVRDDAGKPLYIQSMMRDISERIRRVQQALVLEVQASRLKMLQTFVDSFSHYVRTPLTNIRNSRYLIARDPANPRNSEREKIIDGELARIESLLTDLLLIMKLEQDDLPIYSRRPTHIHTLLLQLIEQQQRLDRERHQWLVTLPANPMLEGGMEQLLDAFHRLIENAVKYTPEGGIIAIDLRANADYAAVAIRDTGIGISADDLPHLTEFFYRGHQAQSLDPQSTGLGLAIAQRIFAHHHGCLHLLSDGTSGTQALVGLPLAGQPTPSLAQLQALLGEAALPLARPATL